jgi:predicted nucleotidyltransferase
MSGEKIASAHPVSDAMRAAILQTLREIESREDVAVLFACESGHRGWGFASPDSDYDVRFIYVRRLERYLTLEPVGDAIEQPVDGELDVNGWDLRKALQLLRDSNPTLLEWLRSPIVYCQHEVFAQRLRAFAEGGFSPVRGYHHYVSMAKKNLRDHLAGEVVHPGQYLCVLRALLAARWIREQRGAPPMRFAELAEATLGEPAVIAEINALLAVRMRAGETAASPRREPLHAFIERELEAAQASVIVQSHRPDSRELDRLLRDAVMHFEAAAAAW